jgi:uncharacterized protein (DUF433 family)
MSLKHAPQNKKGAIQMQDWRAHIDIDPEVLVGKPVVKGTRLAVAFILELLAENWSQAEILENYPRLRPEDIQACLAYASAILNAERVYILRLTDAPAG